MTTVEFLKLHELLPVPALSTLQSRWTPDILRGFLDRYLAFARQNAATISLEANETRIFLDPLDAHVREAYLQHLLIADRVVIVDPITALHCPARQHNEWLRELRDACSFISKIQDLINMGFVVTVPDPCHCGLQKDAIERTTRVLEDPEACRPWYEFGHVCKSETEASVQINDEKLRATLYHIHLGRNSLHTFRSKCVGDSNSKPRVHVEVNGKFKRMSVQHAVNHENLKESVTHFFTRQIFQHQASLLMSRQWCDSRYSSLNPLSASVVSRDIDRLSRTVGQASNWVAPAKASLKLLGFDGSNVGMAQEVKAKYHEPFRRYSTYMREVFSDIQRLPADQHFQREVKEIVNRTLAKEIVDCEREIRSCTRSIKTGVGFFGLIGVSATALALGDPSQWQGAATLALGALSTLVGPAEAISRVREVRQNPVYFLIKAQKHGLSK